jgi:putative Mn2+ efflux pump MntP
MWSAIALAFGLAMDATAVSAARGLGAHGSRDALVLPALFGGFQAGMAALGWFAGWWVGPYIAAWDHWVAFGLLVAIGGKMVVEAVRGRPVPDAPDAPDTDARTQPGESSARRATASPAAPSLALDLGLALATSIDAAAAGLTLPLVPVAPWIALLLIGAITAACSAIGVVAGRIAGKHLGAGLEILGGLVLIGIAIELLVRSL